MAFHGEMIYYFAMDARHGEPLYGGRIYRIPPDILAQAQQHPLLADFMLTRMGHFIRADHHQSERSTINEYILMYCTAGSGWLRLDHRTWTVRAGDVAVVFEGCEHGYGSDAADPWTIQWAHLAGPAVLDYLTFARLDRAQPVVRVRGGSRLEHLFAEIATVLQRGYSLHHLVVVSDCLRRVLSHIAFKTAFVRQSSTLDVEAILDLMVDHLRSDDLTLDRLAGHACLTPSHFSRRFREATGYPPIDYYIRLKIQKACELLDATPMTVSQISDYLGYKNVYYFSRVFKKIVGQSPTHYREG